MCFLVWVDGTHYERCRLLFTAWKAFGCFIRAGLAMRPVGIWGNRPPIRLDGAYFTAFLVNNIQWPLGAQQDQCNSEGIPQHFLSFLPLPQGQGSLRPSLLRILCDCSRPLTALASWRPLGMDVLIGISINRHSRLAPESSARI